MAFLEVLSNEEGMDINKEIKNEYKKIELQIKSRKRLISTILWIIGIIYALFLIGVVSGKIEIQGGGRGCYIDKYGNETCYDPF